jgi:hypothetical protein
MFHDTVSGLITDLTPNDHTRFQCSVSINVPLAMADRIAAGTLIAAENIYSKSSENRYTVLQLISAFPEEPKAKSKNSKQLSFACSATPVGIELILHGKKEAEIVAADTFPSHAANVSVLNDEATAKVIHQIAPESRSKENGSRADIGYYAANPDVLVGLDHNTLIRGNAAIISSRPRARTTITNNLISALMRGTDHPLHIIYCDVNNIGTLSLANLIHEFDEASVLAINDKFIPSSVFQSMKLPNDRQIHKRAVLDYLDMMILPSVMEERRQDFIYPISTWLRSNKIAIYRAHEQTIDEFINEIRIDILEGVDAEVEEYVTGVLDGIATTYSRERFNEKNTKDMLEMIDEFSQEAKGHGARRTLYDVRAEIQAAYETYSKDIPGSSRKTLGDLVNKLNDENNSSLTVVQGQKTTDILRFIGSLLQGLVDERVKRLKIRVPVLVIFNNADEYIPRAGSVSRESGVDRFQEILQMLLANGRRHGLGFCLTLEQAQALEGTLARRIQSYFVGSLRFREEPEKAGELMNVADELLRPAVSFEDGCFLLASADSPYHRRVPLPVCIKKNTEVLHEFLDGLGDEHERRRKDMQQQEEERIKKLEIQRKEEQKRQEEMRKRKELEREARELERQAQELERKAKELKRQSLDEEIEITEDEVLETEDRPSERPPKGGRDNRSGRGYSSRGSSTKSKPKSRRNDKQEDAGSDHATRSSSDDADVSEMREANESQQTSIDVSPEPAPKSEESAPEKKKPKPRATKAPPKRKKPAASSKGDDEEETKAPAKRGGRRGGTRRTTSKS